MFKKILIANRGDRLRAALTAAKPERLARAACAGDHTARAGHV
jgi:acetyl/propionyl-CoA carboxylase alpha subunit